MDQRSYPLRQNREIVLDSVWSLGGAKGWPSMDWAWKVRGVIDRMVGGIGVRRGRRHPQELRIGDGLDFWRVLFADKDSGRLILYAEMKLPGEAWLEFKLHNDTLIQTATFRPRGLMGRLYWWSIYSIHLILFPDMIRKLAKDW